MITAFLLMITPGATWDRIARARRGMAFVLVAHLLPLLFLASFAEGWGLVHWGKWVGPVSRLKRFPAGEIIVFEMAQLLLSLLVVFICAAMVKSAGQTFHGRHTYPQAFVTVAYGLAPLFLLRCVNAFSPVSTWVGWGMGFILAIAVLYHGVPRSLQPDPAHAFGLYLISSLMVFLTTGISQLLTYCYLTGRFPDLEKAFIRLAERLPV